MLPELIDRGPDHYSPAEYRDCLAKLGRVGRWLGGDRAGLAAFRSLPAAPASILDIGCGGGGFTRRLAERFPDARVVGEDLNAAAIEFARERHGRSNLDFRAAESPAADWGRDSFDVVTATLVCHHLDDGDVADFLRRACRAARYAVVLNDLHRHRLAHVSFSWIAPIFFRNRLICHDGPLSVRKGFTRNEWARYLETAGIPARRCHVYWRWAFRWIVVVDTGP